MDSDRQKLYIDTERVILCVRARANIWCPTHAHYNNRRQRALAWQAVCREVLPHYQRYDDEQRKELEKRVQQRWRTARDSYVKARTRPAAPDATYAFMNQLAFLEPTLRARPPPPPTPPIPPRPQEAVNEQSPAKRSRPASPPALAEAEVEVEGELGGVLAALLARVTSPLQEDDEAFFRSLAPALATLDARHKLLLRRRLLATVLDVQAQCNAAGFLEGCPSPSPPPYDVYLQEEPLEQKYCPPHQPAGEDAEDTADDAEDTAEDAEDAEDAEEADTDSSSAHSAREACALNISH